MFHYKYYLHQYIDIFNDGQDAQEMPGSIPLLGLGRQAFTNAYTFDGGYEPYIYAVFSEYGALECHTLPGRVAYLPNVLRIRVNQWDSYVIKYLFYILPSFKYINDAVIRIPMLEVKDTKRPKVDYVMSRGELNDIYRRSSCLWHNGSIHEGCDEYLSIPPFVDFEIKHDTDDEIRVITITGNDIVLEIYSRALVVYIRGEKIVVLQDYLVFYWGGIVTKVGYRLLCQYGLECKSSLYEDIFSELINMTQQKPLRALPTPIQQAIAEQIPPYTLFEGDLNYDEWVGN